MQNVYIMKWVCGCGHALAAIATNDAMITPAAAHVALDKRVDVLRGDGVIGERRYLCGSREQFRAVATCRSENIAEAMAEASRLELRHTDASKAAREVAARFARAKDAPIPPIDDTLGERRS